MFRFVLARLRPKIFPSSSGAPSAVNLQSTPSACHAANRPSANPVSLHHFSGLTVPAPSVVSDSFCSGQSTLPSSCPVCEHSPVSAEDCTPHKTHRTTIRVFLRTHEKKREEAKLKESRISTPTTPVEAKSTPQEPAPTQSPAAQTTSQPPSAPVAGEDSQNVPPAKHPDVPGRPESTEGATTVTTVPAEVRCLNCS